MQDARQAAPSQLQSTTAPKKDAMQQSAVRAALIRMHAATVLFGISGIFGKLCQCSAIDLVWGRAVVAVAALPLILPTR